MSFRARHWSKSLFFPLPTFSTQQAEHRGCFAERTLASPFRVMRLLLAVVSRTERKLSCITFVSDVVLIWMLPYTRHRWLIKIWTTGLLDMVECNHRCRNWFAVPRWLDDLKPFAVIGLTRIYCNQSDEFYLVDVSSQDAPTRVEQLREQGWDIEAEIPVWDSSLKARNDFCVASKNLYNYLMGIYAADHPIVEHQDEDSFDAWLRRKQKEKEEPWDFSAEVESSSL